MSLPYHLGESYRSEIVLKPALDRVSQDSLPENGMLEILDVLPK